MNTHISTTLSEIRALLTQFIDYKDSAVSTEGSQSLISLRCATKQVKCVNSALLQQTTPEHSGTESLKKSPKF